MKTTQILFAGFGGQGILFSGKFLAYKGLMEDSINVSGALQGQTPHSGTSAALYAQQTANSSTPIASPMRVLGLIFIPLSSI